MRHECTHGLLHSVLPMVPLWLDEGLAEYFEVPEDQRSFGNPHLRWTRLDARMNHVPPLVQLEAKRDLSQMSSTDYRHAWAWTHFMLHGPPEARQELVDFLADIARNNPPGLLSDRLEKTLAGHRQAVEPALQELEALIASELCANGRAQRRAQGSRHGV